METITSIPRPAEAGLPVRQNLLDTARQLFACRGFHAVSLRQLGQAVGLHAGSLYAHIASKEGLLQELVEEGYERLLDSAMIQLERAAKSGALRVFLHHHVSFQLNNAHWYILASVESRHLSNEAQSELRELRGEYALLLEHLLHQQLGGCDPEGIANLARQTLQLLDSPPGAENTGLDDCIDDLSQLILNRLSRQKQGLF